MTTTTTDGFTFTELDRDRAARVFDVTGPRFTARVRVAPTHTTRKAHHGYEPVEVAELALYVRPVEGPIFAINGVELRKAGSAMVQHGNLYGQGERWYCRDRYLTRATGYEDAPRGAFDKWGSMCEALAAVCLPTSEDRHQCLQHALTVAADNAVRSAEEKLEQAQAALDAARDALIKAQAADPAFRYWPEP